MDGIITSWNRAAERIFGWSAHEMLGQPIARLVPADLQRQEAEIISQLRQGQRIDALETERLTKAGATFEHYRTMYEAATDPTLVADNPLFGPSPANPSGFSYPATRSFANVPGMAPGDPRPAPYLGEHSEQVLAERLGLSSGQIADLIDRGIVATSDKDKK